MPAIFFNYQRSIASAILKPCIDFHFSTYVFLRLTCFQHADLPSQSSCAKSMSWWLQNPLKFQFSTLLKIVQPSFRKAKHIPMALFVCSIILCFSVHSDENGLECIMNQAQNGTPCSDYHYIVWVFSTRTWLSLSFVCLFFTWECMC